VRVFAAAILAAYHAPAGDVLPILCAGLESDDSDVATAACSALARLGPAATPAIPALRDRVLGEPTGHKAAMDALVQLGEPAIPALIELLDRGDTTDKWLAAIALGDLGEPARIALPALRKLSIQRTTLASAAAKKAIRKLGGDIR
jgi:HEAT repeat protein